jgi:acetolactate synthase-1/2/3 large subunit
VIPCSSGGAFTVMMQAFEQKLGQVLVTDKGLASMGYGLAGAIGAALSSRDRRTILVEGDGGFSQNLQELATVDVQNLNLKIFIFSNEGYASIRMTQKNYFDGAYLGCDTQSGLGFPNWKVLASAFGISASVFNQNSFDNNDFLKTWNSQAPHIYVVPIHPEQTYYPKIASRVAVNGGMESAPLHLMTPELTTETLQKLHYYSVE